MIELTKKEKAIVALLKENEDIKIKDLSFDLKISLSVIHKRLASLYIKFGVTNRYRLLDKINEGVSHDSLSKYKTKPFSFYDVNGDFIKIMITCQGQSQKLITLLEEIGGEMI